MQEGSRRYQLLGIKQAQHGHGSRYFTITVNELQPLKGFPWWSSGKDFTSKCRECGGESLVKELRSHTPQGQKMKAKKRKQYCNKLNKDLEKWSTAKEIFKKWIITFKNCESLYDTFITYIKYNSIKN